MERTILVFAETRNGLLRNVSLESLAAAKMLAAGGNIAAVVFGSEAKQFANVLGQHGADRVYTLVDKQLDIFTTDTYTQAFTQMVKEINPDVILMGHTGIGKDLSPRVAAKLNLGLISDVTDLALEGSEIIFTRPIYAGKAFEKRMVANGMIFATIRPNNIPLGEKDSERKIESIEFPVDLKYSRTIVKEVVGKAIERIDLAEAKIVVSGGRGMRSREGFLLLRHLADVLDAAVGASRGACDAGYCDYTLQIGQTGKVITPDLYIACGISGAIQHLAGMSNSKVIVAINKDPEAPIFKIADYGIVGDLFEVVPLLTEEFKKLRDVIHAR